MVVDPDVANESIIESIDDGESIKGESALCASLTLSITEAAAVDDDDIGNPPLHRDDNDYNSQNAHARFEYAGRKPKWWRKKSGRRGTRSQRAVIDRMAALGYVLRPVPYGKKLDLGEIFGRDASAADGGEEETWLELGFGDGSNLLANARRHPAARFLGAEVHQPGVGAILVKMEAALWKVTEEERSGVYGIEEKSPIAKAEEALNSSGDKEGREDVQLHDNVRIFPGDGIKLLRSLPSHSIDALLLTFPDPFPKRSDARYRVVQLDTVQEMGRVLKGHGRFYLATDDVSYDGWTREVFGLANKEVRDGIKLCEDWEEVRPCPQRDGWLPVVSRYEAKGLAEGRKTLLQCWEIQKARRGDGQQEGGSDHATR